MKRALTFLVLAILLVSLGIFATAAEVVRTNQSLVVDGTPVACEIYNIDGSNYFKLRDLAFLLNGTGSQFAVGYDNATRTVTVNTGTGYLPNGSELVIGEDQSKTAGPSTQTILINGILNSALSAYNIGGNNFFKLRELGDALGFDVDYDNLTRTMLVNSKRAESPQPTEDTVSFQSVSACGITADVLSVNIKNPKVRVEASMVDKTVAARAAFSDIVAASNDAVAVITGNFMNGDKEGNFPVGHVMVNGELLYIGSGYSSLGITSDGDARFGRPSIRVRMNPLDQDYFNKWTAIGLNLKENEQEAQYSVLYTPAFGTEFEVTCSGSVTIVEKNIVKEYMTVQPEDHVLIPRNGYVLWLSDTYMQEFVWNFQHPTVGEPVELEYFLYYEDEEGFVLDNVTQIISGAPRLVQDGKGVSQQEPQFSGDRFTDDYSASRTAVGSTADGKLVFVSTNAATIPQLREFMLSLACVDAINLDGGASTGLYYAGKTYRTPGRLLATTVSIYVD